MTAKVSSGANEGEYAPFFERFDPQRIDAHTTAMRPTDTVVEQDIVEIILQRMLGRVQDPTK